MKSIINFLNESSSLTGKYLEEIKNVPNKYNQTVMVGYIKEIVKSRISASKLKYYADKYNKEHNTNYKLYNIDLAENGTEFEFNPSIKNYTLVVCDCFYKDEDISILIGIIPGQAKDKTKLLSK